MGDFAADTLRDSIESGWALTGRLSKTAAADMKETVKFFAHPQNIGNEWTKAIEVIKMITAGNENVIIHPRFTIINDRFEIRCRYRLKSGDETKWDQAEADIEDICEEVIRIVETVYDPSAGTGAFFTTSRQWRNLDNLTNASKPELIRVLMLTLSRVQSEDSKIFDGFGGVLTFDVSASSNMDSAPGGDRIYTAAHSVRIGEGYTVTEALYKNNTNGSRVPRLGAGRFRGTFSAQLYADSDDIGSTAEKLNQIYLLQANGQHVEATFLHAITNNNSETLTQTSFVKITFMEKITTDTELASYNVQGRLVKPSTMAVA